MKNEDESESYAKLFNFEGITFEHLADLEPPLNDLRQMAYEGARIFGKKKDAVWFWDVVAKLMLQHLVGWTGSNPILFDYQVWNLCREALFAAYNNPPPVKDIKFVNIMDEDEMFCDPANAEYVKELAQYITCCRDDIPERPRNYNPVCGLAVRTIVMSAYQNNVIPAIKTLEAVNKIKNPLTLWSEF